MKIETPILLASDHAGFQLKEVIKKHLNTKCIDMLDLGADSEEASDYPDFGHKIGQLISEGTYEKGISVCGTGNGINMTTNKYKGVRGALCWNEKIAELARRHNDANLCALPSRFVSVDEAIKIVDAFVGNDFDGGRHTRRKDKIDL